MALLVIGGLVLLGAFVVALQLRNARRDSRSVDAHHQMLDRLQHAAESHPEHAHPHLGPHVRVVPNGADRRTADTPPADVPAAPPPPPVAETPPPPPPPEVDTPPAPPAGGEQGPSPEVPAPRPSPPQLTPSGLPLGIIHPVGSRRRLTRVRPSRRTAIATSALLVAGAATAIGLVLAGGNSPTGATHGPRLAAPQGATAHPTLPPSPATTTPTRAPTATATSTGPTGATYVVTATPIDLTVAASNRCWVELRSGSATGPLLFEGLLVAGSSHTFSNPSGVWLRLGYPPAVSVQVDGSRVNLPVSGQPYDVSVQTA